MRRAVLHVCWWLVLFPAGGSGKGRDLAALCRGQPITASDSAALSHLVLIHFIHNAKHSIAISIVKRFHGNRKRRSLRNLYSRSGFGIP